MPDRTDPTDVSPETADEDPLVFAEAIRRLSRSVVVISATAGPASAEISTGVVYPDESLVTVAMRASAVAVEYSDGGGTIDYLRRSVPTVWDVARLKRRLTSKDSPVALDGDRLVSRNPVDLDGAVDAFESFVWSCAYLAKLEAEENAEYDRQLKADFAARREGRREFRLSSRDDVEAFERWLRTYTVSRSGEPFDALSPVEAYDALTAHRPAERERILADLFDLILGYCVLADDLTAVRREWKNYVAAGGASGGSALDDAAAFAARLQTHRFVTAFVLRYRALWDKIMGVLVLAPDRYKDFDGAKSKRRVFTRISTAVPSMQGLGSSITDSHLPRAEPCAVAVERSHSLVDDRVDVHPEQKAHRHRHVVDAFGRNLQATHQVPPRRPVSGTYMARLR